MQVRPTDVQLDQLVPLMERFTRASRQSAARARVWGVGAKQQRLQLLRLWCAHARRSRTNGHAHRPG